MRAHRLHIAADFRRIVHALDHGEVAQYGEGDDVFIAQARAEVVGAGNERQQRGLRADFCDVCPRAGGGGRGDCRPRRGNQRADAGRNQRGVGCRCLHHF